MAGAGEMIVAGYTLDLYCQNRQDGVECKDPDQWRGGKGEFVGESGPACRADARRAGWKLDLTEGEAFCPYCTGKKKAPEALSEPPPLPWPPTTPT